MSKFRYTTRTTKLVLAAVVASIVFAGVYGFAASLGLGSSGLGAGNATVASCGTGIQAAYSTAYSATLPGYSVTQVNLSAIPAGCLSKSYRVQLTGAGNAAVRRGGGAGQGPLRGSGESVAVRATVMRGLDAPPLPSPRAP